MMDMVLVQGTQSRTRLLAAHAERVESGLPSVLFGLQSFGEGLDLPGALCETVFIAKLPFAPPSDPVDEARAEWLRSVGRDPFNELGHPGNRRKTAAMDRPRHTHRGRPRAGHRAMTSGSRKPTTESGCWQDYLLTSWGRG